MEINSVSALSRLRKVGGVRASDAQKLERWVEMVKAMPEIRPELVVREAPSLDVLVSAIAKELN